MSKEYFRYLAERIVEYFEMNEVLPGEKFIFTQENDGDTENIVEEIRNLSEKKGIKQDFVYFHEGKDVYHSFSIKKEECLILVANQRKQETTLGFLTTLRNLVGKEKYEKYAILILCFEQLDSLTDGTKRMDDEGMPLFYKSVGESLRHKIGDSQFSNVEKKLLENFLDRKQKIVNRDSLYEFRDVITLLKKEKIEEKDFQILRIFFDEELISQQVPDDKIEERIRDNNRKFKLIDDAVLRGDLETALSNTFRESFIHKLETKIQEAADGKKWDEKIKYEEIIKEEKAKEQSDTEFEILNGDIRVLQNEGDNVTELECLIRNSGDTKIRRRQKHILIFSPNKAEKISIQMKCNKSVSIDKKDKPPKEENVKVQERSRGKLLTFDILDPVGYFGSGRYVLTSTSETFAFSFCIIHTDKKYFDGIANLFLIEKWGDRQYRKWGISIAVPDEYKINFQQNSTIEPQTEISDGGTVEYNLQDGLGITFKNSESYEKQDVEVLLEVNEQEIPVQFKLNEKNSSAISALDVERKKLYEKQSFVYNDSKLSMSGNNYYAKEEFREILQIEAQMLRDQEWLTIHGLPEQVYNSYIELIQEINRQQTLPSLVYIDGNIEVLVRNCIKNVKEYFSTAGEGKPLDESVQACMTLGVYHTKDVSAIALTSLHPLNLEYRLALMQEYIDKEMRSDILEKLNPVNLLPYIAADDGTVYRVQEQSNVLTWTYYKKLGDAFGDGNRHFVSGVVKEKMKEYETHFEYLFPSSQNVLKINAVNMGSCYELLTGLMKYYAEKDEQQIEAEGLRTVDVTIYQEGDKNNYLEALTSKQVKNEYLEKVMAEEKFEKGKVGEIWNRVQRHVRYFKKDITDENFEYAHLTFYIMGTDNKKGYGKMKDIKSGIMLGGLQSGISSQPYGRSYRNGFGIKNLDKETELVQLAKVYNSLYVVYGTSNPYAEGNCITTEIGKDDQNKIKKVYNASGWVVFIEPKVDLNFFREEDNNDQDVIIVHYDDQYTNTSGYDAITVTKKTTQYKKVLEEYLEDHGVSNAQLYLTKLINMFNAVNGNWLLKLVSSKNENFGKEKISMLSAVKLAMAYLYHESIYWIPISMEEIFRVSSAIGLSKNNGLLSLKKLGYQNISNASDDLLMLGVLLDPEGIKVFMYPVEVKIGSNKDAKAGKQLKTTSEVLKEIMTYKDGIITLEKKVYRNFLMQLAIISAEKMNLYDIWSKYDWEAILNTKVRGSLLNDEFEISDELEEYIGEGAVLAFKKEIYTRNIVPNNEFYQLDFLYQDGINFMLKDVTDLITLLENTTINSEILLKKRYLVQENSGVEPEEPLNDSEESRFMVSPDLEERKMQILLGKNALTGKDVYWHPNDTSKIMHINTGIIGTMGTGKTQFTKALITQIVKEQKYNVDSAEIGILIFDYKGDYNQTKQDFMDAVKPKVYNLYHLPYNPFSLNSGGKRLPLLPIRVADTFRDTLAKAYNLGVKQSAVLSDLIIEAYARKGILPEQQETWDRPAPTFQDVYQIYMEKDEIKKDDSLYSALSTLNKYQIFEPDVDKTKSLFELINGVMVIDLSSENETVQNLIVAITLDLFYSQMQALGHSKIDGAYRQLSKIILVDEADNLLRVGFPSVRKILKEGREFGVGMILSTQFLKHFNTEEEDYSSYIWTWVVHSVADFGIKDVKNVFSLDDKNEIDILCGEIRRLEKHTSFLKMEQGTRPVKLEDYAFWKLLEDSKQQ